MIGKSPLERLQMAWQVFDARTTPPALYARQKWLGQESTASWQRDFDRTVVALRSGQQPSGLWQDSSIATIQRLFGLHLTVRAADPGIDHALDVLLTSVRAFLGSGEFAPLRSVTWKR